jgi:hypothetical protein
MDNRLFELILAFVPVLGTIITAFIVPYIKAKIGTENLAKYEYWVNIAVRAAEMIWVETGHGEDKKAYVVEFMNKLFNSKKTVITEEQINVLIEAAVKQLKIEEAK